MSEARSKVILIGWDAADWQIIRPLLDRGEMPTLKKFLEEGTSGHISTMQPPLSPMLWNSIATGKVAAKHGILGFVEPRADGAGIQSVTSTSRKTKAIWNIASQNGLRSIVVGWFASHPAEPVGGAIVADQLIVSVLRNDPSVGLPAGSFHPPSIADKLTKSRVFPSQIGSRLLNRFIPGVDSLPPSRREVLAKLKRNLATCGTIQASFLELLKQEPADFAAVYFQTIDHVCHGFMPFHPPRMPHVPKEDFGWFQNVVAETYRYHDAMLADILSVAGSDATIAIISDHGFVSDHLRPQTLDTEENPPAWHRSHGIFAIRGPGIRRGYIIHGASIIDATPTMLTLLGLPVAADMDGKVLLDVFAERPNVSIIPSWDLVSGPKSPGTHPPDMQVDPFEQAESLRQLVELGYIADPGSDAKKAIDRAKVDAGLNLAWSEVDHHPENAAKIVELLDEQFPDVPEVQSLKLQTELTAKKFAKASVTLGKNGEHMPHLQPAVRLSLVATIAAGLRDYPAALRALADLSNLDPRHPMLHSQLGQVYSRQRNWKAALAAFARAIEIDPSSAQAYWASGYAHLRLGEYAAAVDQLLSAIERLHDLPGAHLHLGLALLRLNLPEQAFQSFLLALKLNPSMVTAHRLLAVANHRLGHLEQAARHREAVQRIHRARNTTPA